MDILIGPKSRTVMAVYLKGVDRDLLAETKKLLKIYDIHPKKRLGQNFLIDPRIIKELIDYAEIEPTEVVLDVGSGLGYLTEALTHQAKAVIATEVDYKLIKILKERLRDKGNVKILAGDILSITLPRFDKVVSAPPYKISSPLIFRILECSFKTTVLILQREFATRLRALPGDSNYSRLSVMIHLKAQAEILNSVPSKAFYPEPNVTSSIVRFNPKPKNTNIANLDIFEELLRGLFGQRKRTLRKAIFPFLKYKLRLRDEQINNLRRTLPMMGRRVFTLSPEEFVVLANTVSERIPG